MKHILKQLAFLFFASLSFGEVYEIDSTETTKVIKNIDYGLGTTTSPSGEKFGANNYYLIRNGEPWFPVMGEVHFSRLTEDEWEDSILKMKAGGITTVATYCFWIHHEEIEGQFDFKGQRNIKKFVQLCQKHDMKVWLRIGPWCHGEVVNGGFPNWLMKKPFKLRKSNRKYMALVNRLWKQYFKQVRGLLHKDGGPIVGIQLENEYGGAAQHISRLKKLARKIGFDVPYYSVTGWNNVKIPQNSVIPVQAGYPDNFWDKGFARTKLNKQYLFMTGLPINTGVGTDVLPVLSVHNGTTYDLSEYPWLTAELGLGIQVTERRRPVIDTQDALALALVKIAGGANCIGYYMYHGGSNPIGKKSFLHEARWNICPKISYDFQAAIGEFGEVYSKYHDLKLLHYWVNFAGTDLAPMVPALPSKKPSGVADVDTFRTMLRADDNSGYLFFNNYQRFVENKDLRDIQVKVVLKDKTITIPSQPITVPADSCGLWPVNLSLNGSILTYATAQPFARFSGESTDSIFFFAQKGITPEFSIDTKTIKKIDTSPGISKKSFGEETVITVEKAGVGCYFTLHSANEKPVTIHVISHKDALNSFILQSDGERKLVVTDGAYALNSPQGMELRSLNKAAGKIWGFNKNKPAAEAFSMRKWSVPKHEFQVQLSPSAAKGEAQVTYQLTVPGDALKPEHVHDIYLDIDQISDYLEIYNNGRLLGDWFYFGPHYRPSLRVWGEQALGKTLEIRLKPLQKGYQYYIEPRFRPEFGANDSLAKIKKITPIPLYRTQQAFPE